MSSGDPRIPIVFGATSSAGDDDAVLTEGSLLSCGAGAVASFTTGPKPAHPTACSCCSPRGAVAEGLTRLFLAQMHGDVPWFRRVVAVTASAAGEAAVREAVGRDPLIAARFRLG